MIKTIIFDLDGTLIDSEMIILKSYDYAFSKVLKNHKEPSLTGYRKYILTTLRGAFLKNTNDEQIIEEGIKTYLEYYRAHELESISIFDNVKETLLKLKDMGVKLVLFTNKMLKSAEPSLKHFGIYDLFDEMITINDTKDEPKPSPRGIFISMDKTSSTKDETLMVGDCAIDIISGKNAGVKTALVSFNAWFDEAKKEKPDYIIDKFNEIIKIVGD